MKKYFNILNIIFILIFSALMLLPMLNSTLHIFKVEAGNENRTKTARPEFDFSKLDAFVRDYDKYYTDNFSLRENGIEFHNKMEYTLWGVSPVPDKVVLGKDGWFYDKDNIGNYSGANAFTKEQLDSIKDELVFRTKWASEHNVKYYIAVVPSKMSIYPEYLPSKIIKVSDAAQYDQFITLDRQDGINIIDVRKNLMKHKNDGYYIYQKTDGHWNDFGAYFGYQEIMKRLSIDFPNLQSISLDDYSISIKDQYGGNTVTMINLEKEYHEQFVKLTEKNKIYAVDGPQRDYQPLTIIPLWENQIIKENSNGKKLKCLIFRDSFTLLLIRYMQENFKETVFIHDGWKFKMHEDMIEKEKPDIVIDIIFERGLNSFLKYPFKK